MASEPPEPSASPAPPEPSAPPLSERTAWAFLAIERYALPWIYFLVAWPMLFGKSAPGQPPNITIRLGILYRILNDPHTHATGWPVFLAGMTRDILIAILAIFVGFTLFLTSRPVHLPKKLSEIWVPIVMSYYFFLYRTLDHWPPFFRQNLLPSDWRVPAAFAALFFAIAGYTMSIWGLSYLRRSFAVFVAVREVVSTGPYTIVRHPMYCGYLLELIGLLFASFTPAMILLALGFILLTITRARLEEARILEACPAYAEYMQNTGFLFPRFL